MEPAAIRGGGHPAPIMFFIIYMDPVPDGICLKKAAERSAAFYILYEKRLIRHLTAWHGSAYIVHMADYRRLVPVSSQPLPAALSSLLCSS